MQNLIQFSDEVQSAKDQHLPLVALESTVITHGLPYPENIATALAMEAAVRDGGAVPVTIGILSGRIIAGLSPDQIEYLGRQAGRGTVRKCSRRDLPIVVGCREDGATTVAGTMLIAHMANIELFATGGIGGVHRGHPFDISADLRELGQTPVTVVSSGAKSILDLPATREVLETEGVTIIGYGTDEIPAFFAPSSGLPVDVRLDSPGEVAALIQARRHLGLSGGTLVTVPPPMESRMDPDEAEAAAVQAAREADEQGIHGPAATPWLLRRVAEITGGRSIKTNTALLHNNGRVAAMIAVALKRLGEE